jgi:hypothetical protein
VETLVEFGAAEDLWFYYAHLQSDGMVDRRAEQDLLRWMDNEVHGVPSGRSISRCTPFWMLPGIPYAATMFFGL